MSLSPHLTTLVLASAPLALVACGSAHAAPDPVAPREARCSFPEVALRNQAGQKVGGWVDLAKRLAPDAAVKTEAEAIARVCQYREGCGEKMVGLCDNEYQTTCFVRAPGEGPATWYAFGDVFDQADNGLELKFSLSPDRRFMHAALTQEFIGRIEDAMCETDEEGNANCVSATGSFGWQHADLVIDLSRMTLVWDARHSNYDDSNSGEDICKHRHAISFEGTTFLRTSCSGDDERFEAKDLGACTVAAREAAQKAEADAREATRMAVATADTRRAKELVEEGRKLTRAKDYAGAIKAFDRALAAVFAFPTALSGRGYARLQRAEGDDLAKARSDFEEALISETSDKKFRGAVLFNLGLLCEKQKKTEEAKGFFEKAHAQNPTAATREKLGL